MILRHKNIDSELRKELIAHVYGVIGCMHKVCEGLPSGLPEYVYQEAFKEVVDMVRERIVRALEEREVRAEEIEKVKEMEFRVGEYVGKD